MTSFNPGQARFHSPRLAYAQAPPPPAKPVEARNPGFRRDCSCGETVAAAALSRYGRCDQPRDARWLTHSSSGKRDRNPLQSSPLPQGQTSSECSELQVSLCFSISSKGRLGYRWSSPRKHQADERYPGSSDHRLEALHNYKNVSTLYYAVLRCVALCCRHAGAEMPRAGDTEGCKAAGLGEALGNILLQERLQNAYALQRGVKSAFADLGMLDVRENAAARRPAGRKRCFLYPREAYQKILRCCCGKLCESIAAKQIASYVYLLQSACQSEVQHAYRKLHSTETALLKMTDDWLDNMDNGFMTAVVLLDYSAAFDLVDHNLLLQKLETYGFTKVAWDWTENLTYDNHIAHKKCNGSLAQVGRVRDVLPRRQRVAIVNA
ncbi:hypothetical protein Bbelb_362020 [Branchiostoma belcheri]|nr:hypothetical protein Bbelb_362020 [Branchiostoma belcheri]